MLSHSNQLSIKLKTKQLKLIKNNCKTNKKQIVLYYIRR